MAKHSKLPPSGAHRWMNCAGSVALIGDEPNDAGRAAMKGTANHAIVERMVKGNQHDASQYADHIVLVERLTGDTILFPPAHADALDKRDGWHAFIIDEKAVGNIQTMIDEVDRIRATMYEPEIFAERYVDMSWLDDRLGGTVDVTLVEHFAWAHIVDYKNGYVVVEAGDNEQLKNYALGVLHEHDDIEGVRVTIVQPNAPHEEGVIRSDAFTRAELLKFQRELKAAADATSKPNATLRAGDWCTFCPAKTRCSEFEAMQRREARMDFADDPAPIELPAASSDSALAAAYRADLAQKARWIPLFDAWARDIERAIQDELESGNPVDGFKLVAKKSNRAWSVGKNVLVERWTEAGWIDYNLFTEPKLRSPAQVEKLGKMFKSFVAENAHKPFTGYTVALAIDPREAVSPQQAAIAEFADAAEDDES